MQKIAAVVVVVLLATAVWAQDIETMITGNANIAGPTLAEAWMQNPATLGSFAGCAAAVDGTSWMGRVSGVYETQGMTDMQAITLGGIPAGANYGFGAGWTSTNAAENLGFGAGLALGKGLSVGANYWNMDPDAPGADSNGFVDVGLAGSFGALFGSSATTWGLVARDVTDEVQDTYDAGLQVVAGGWRLAVDVQDFTDEVDSIVQYGASRSFGTDDRWLVGAGVDDGDATAGVCYNVNDANSGKVWKLGVAWAESDAGDDVWVLGVSTNLGN